MSLEETAAALATTGLSEAAQIKILRLKGVSAETAAAMVQTYGYAASETTATTATTGLTAATSVLQVAINGLKVAFASNPIGFIITAVATAIPLVISLASKIKSASEQFEESTNEVKELTDKINELNNDLDTTNSRIEELLRKDTLTIVEKAELDRLKETKANLEQIIALRNSELSTAKGKKERDFVNSINSTLDEENNVMGAGHVSNKNMFSLMVSRYLNSDSSDSAKEAAKKWLDEFVPKFNEAIEAMSDYEYSTLSEDAKKAYDEAIDIQNTYLAAMKENYDTVFDSIFNQARFSKGREALENAVEAGLTSKEVETLYNNDDSVKAMIDNMKDVGLINEVTSDTFKELAAQIEIANQAVGTIAENEKIAFSDLISNEKIQDTIDGFKSKVTTLSEALENLHSGDLSDSDLIELFKEFPELANRTDDLDVALNELIDSTQTEIDNQFESWKDNMPTEEDAAGLDAVKNSLIGISEKAKGLNQVAAEVDKLNSALDDLQSTYSNIKNVIDDYNNNGYLTLDNLQSIMDLQPEYLNLLIDENGQINLNNQAYKDYVVSKAKSLLVNQLSSLYESILAMSEEEAQAYANTRAFDGETRSVKDLLSATTELYIMQAHQKDAANGNTFYMDALTKSFDTAANYASIVESYINSLNTSQNEFAAQANGTTSALETQKKALESEKDALEDYKNSLENTKDELEDYKDALEDAQDNIQSLIDLTIDYIKQMKENEKDAINDQIDALDKQKDALNDQKDAYSDLISKKKEEIELLYEEKKAQDELSDKQKSAAKDALALAIAKLDDSSTGKKAQKQAQDDYTSSQKDLKDYLDEQEKDKRITALEEEEEKYEEMIEKRKAAIDTQVERLEAKINEIDAYLDNSRKLYEDACWMIDNDNGTLYSNLWNYTYNYTTQTRAEFDHLWSSAQAAIQRYKGDNDILIDTMETLQSKIYDTDSEIANLNGQIDNCEIQIDELDTAIGNTSTAIDIVASSIGGLGDNISKYKKALDELKSADTEDKIPSNAKWTFDYYKDGKEHTAWTTSSDYETAVRDIQSIVEKETGYYRPDVWGGIKKRYASGTRNSQGLSITQEDGFEAIFGKLSRGQYTLMPQGSQVFNADMTDNLWEFSSNPQSFVSDIIGKMSSFLTSSYGNFADKASGAVNRVTKYGNDMTFNSAPVYNIYGKVDKDTLSKMDKQEKQRYETFKKQFMLEVLRGKNSL